MQHDFTRPFAKALFVSSVIAFSSSAALMAQPTSITEQEARDIAVDAYIYLYPLVSMDVTRRQLSNVEPGKGFGGPMNKFANIRTYPRAEDRAVVRPNFDTLYSASFLDIREEPVVVSVPDTSGRYYLLPMLDMWTDVFASPGWRTTGTKAANFVVVAKNWRPEERARLIDDYKLPRDTRIVEAPTPFVWIIGRTKTDGPADYEIVHKIQDGFKITPASQWGKSVQNIPFKPDPTVDMKTPPKIQVDTMSPQEFFAYGAELMKVNPPHLTDQPIIERMKRIGIEPGKGFDPEKADTPIKNAVSAAAIEAQRLMSWKVETLARTVNGWQMNTDTMGVYGNYYLKRAVVAQVGLGANLPEDAIYPFNLGDSSGQPLNGSNRYRIHFPKGSTPPVDAFWSVTLYDQEGFQIANELNRFAVSSWMPFRYNADGSLDLIIQNENPGKGMDANWLPAPKGPFTLTMRAYAPRMEALTGRWAPPPVEKLAPQSALSQ